MADFTMFESYARDKGAQENSNFMNRIGTRFNTPFSSLDSWSRRWRFTDFKIIKKEYEWELCLKLLAALNRNK